MARRPPKLNRKLGYFRERFRNNAHECLLDMFTTEQREIGMTRAELAKRIGRDPAQITRWLGGPGSMTLNSLSDFLLGLGLEPVIKVRQIDGKILDKFD